MSIVLISLYLVVACFLALILIVILNPLLIMNGLAFSKHVKQYKDLPYADGERHTSDLFVPDEVDNTKPVIVFVYGGAWDSGHKDSYKFTGVEFAKLGYVTALPNYRLYPDAKFPHFIEDVASACAALPEQLSKLNVMSDGSLADSQNKKNDQPLDVILIGHSAGAHTVAMLNTQAQYLKAAGANVNIKACIGLAGPYDLPLDDPLVIGKFDGVELHDISEQQIDAGHKHNRHDANPINLANISMSKMLLMHGRADVTVGLYHLERFAQRLSELGVEHETIIYDGVPHRHIVGGISGPFQFLNPVFKDITEYLTRING